MPLILGIMKVAEAMAKRMSIQSISEKIIAMRDTRNRAVFIGSAPGNYGIGNNNDGLRTENLQYCAAVCFHGKDEKIGLLHSSQDVDDQELILKLINEVEAHKITLVFSNLQSSLTSERISQYSMSCRKSVERKVNNAIASCAKKIDIEKTSYPYRSNSFRGAEVIFSNGKIIGITQGKANLVEALAGILEELPKTVPQKPSLSQSEQDAVNRPI